MTEAWIGSKTASLDAAVAAAAKLLAASRLPVIAGLGTDVAGARAAIALAQRIGGIVDHMHSDALLRDLDVMRETGMMLTTPNEARLRADFVLLAGPGLFEAWPEHAARLRLADKRAVWLCPGRDAKGTLTDHNIASIGKDPAQLPVMLAALRARCAGRPVGTHPSMEQIDALAAELAKARFGVAIWSAAALDTLSVEMLCGLVKDLNETTRFSGLPLAPSDNAAAVLQVSGWTTGFPLRVAFARGAPEHDPWRFDAGRLVDSGEADCAIWISAYRAHEPAWQRHVPTITVGAEPEHVSSDVAIVTGRPGADHDSVAYWPATGTLSAVRASAPTNATSVANVLIRIAAALPPARSC